MSTKKKEKISIIIPCYNEEEMIDLCHSSVCAVLDKLNDHETEIIYVNDGSKDNTYNKLLEIRKSDKRAIIINLSRNFGKEAAMTAGINNADGDAIIILDADLQDPPDLIPDLIKVWKKEDADVVYGQRVQREGETWVKKATARAFYRLMGYISNTEIPRNTGDFRLMNRRATDALIQLKERHRFLKGMFAWVGYKQVALLYSRAPRAAGNTKWNYFKLLDFALEGITAFSILPLRIASFCGFLISFFAFAFGGFIILKTLFFGADMPGYASLMVMITFLSGIQLLCIGILGEYIGRIFGETKNRPLYFIENIHGRKEHS
tara:strand:+ start:2417 stop:3376 length:960 start_codon:yes stop_codon:yes gene_type:complete